MYTEIFTGKMSPYLRFALKYSKLQEMGKIHKRVAKHC